MRLVLVTLVVLVCGFFWAVTGISGSPWVTRQDAPREQPVPFSHEHHVGGLGIDCRYCHLSVEHSNTAGIPATKICMNCHSEMWVGSRTLAPVRASWRTDASIPWTRVHDLPGYVYFNHSIHVQKGFGCETCHGRVDTMPLTWQASPLTMEWCLNCHRNPEQYVRPKEQVFSMTWKPEGSQEELGRRLVREYHIESLTSCSTCHR